LAWKKRAASPEGDNDDGDGDGLTPAILEALNDIKEKDYAGPFRLEANKIIELGMVVYGRDKVMIKFVDGSMALSR
jgi:hypothetical protein